MSTPLPRTWYLDPAHFETEMQAVFGRAWLPVAHGSVLSESGDYLATRAAGHEIILLCGEDGIVRAFHNVCQHRAHRLLEGAGRLSTAITCPYHAWSYRLDGSLRYARHSEEVVDFDKARFGLTAVATTQLAGFVTVCFDDGSSEPPETLRSLEALLLADHPSLPVMREVHRREAVLHANWKVIVENYLECYHCDVAHPTFGNFDLATWKHLLGDQWSRQGRVATGREDAAIDHDDFLGLSAWWQWPSVFWARARTPDTFVAVFHEPLGPDRTHQTRLVYAANGHEADELKAFNDLFDDVFAEDVSLVESVQRGLASSGYRGGRLLEQPEGRAGWSEHAVHQFQDWVRRAVATTAHY